MTTIVFNAKTQEIACDSRCTSGNLIISDSYAKAIEHEGSTWFLAGDCADMDLLMDAQLHEELPFALECSAFVIRPDGSMFSVYTNPNKRLCQLPLEFTEGFGSGGDFAVCGLDLGLSTKEAMEYALTKDICSGGAIHIYNKDGIIDPNNSIE